MKPEPPTIELDFDLPHPPEKVWRALTTPELLALWLAPNDLKPAAGARFTVRPDQGPPVACEVIEIDEKRRRLRLAWAVDEEEASTVRFELTATPTGTALRIVHDGFGAAVSAALPPARPPRLRSLHRRARPTAPIRGTRLQWAA